MIYDLTKTLRVKELPDFEPIPISEFDDADMICSELNEAETTLFKYKQMLDLLKRADELTDSITCGHVQYDHMTEYDECSDLDDNTTMDAVHILRKHVQCQVAKFQKYCDDLQIELDDTQQHARDVKAHGSYEQQVRTQWYSR